MFRKRWIKGVTGEDWQGIWGEGCPAGKKINKVET